MGKRRKIFQNAELQQNKLRNNANGNDNLINIDVGFDEELNDDDMMDGCLDTPVDTINDYVDSLDRRLFLSDEISQKSVGGIVKDIIRYNAEDADIPPSERTPIKIFITSDGGDVVAGFQLIDVIQSSKTPVFTINLGCWYSTALLVGIAGHKRFASKNCTFLLHDGFDTMCNSGAKVRDQMGFIDKLEDRVKDYVIGATSVTEQEYDDKYRIEWYLFAEEAKEKGFVDCIIGTDCGLEAVIYTS